MTQPSPNLKQLPDKRWRARVSGTDQRTGQRVQLLKTFPTKKAARDWQSAVLADLGRDEYQARSATTFDALADAWLADKQVRVRAITYRSYTGALKHARAEFGSVPVQRITPEHVRRLVRTMAATHKKRSVTLTLFCVRGVLTRAVADGLIAKNPATDVEAAGGDSGTRDALPSGDADLIAAHLVGDRLEGCWLLTLAGLRRSEVMGLRWSDLDLDTGMVVIARGRVQLLADRVEVGNPKSKASARTIYVGGPHLAGLRRMRAARAREVLRLGASWDEDAYLAVTEALDPTEAPDPIRPEWYSDEWLRLCDAAGVPRVTLHAARHGAATRLHRAGVPVGIAAAHLGHDPAVMLKTYTHPDEGDLRRASDALAAGA